MPIPSINFSANKGIDEFMKFSKRFSLKNAQEFMAVTINNYFQNKDDGGEIVKQSPIWIRLTVTGLMSSAVFGLAWLSVAKTDEVVTVNGKLEPLGSVKDIQMPMGGIASEILVEDGQEVQEGQIVVQLDTETTQQRFNSLKTTHGLKLHQLKLKENELKQYLLLNDEEVNILSNNLKIQREILDRYEYLLKEGAAAELQYLQQVNRVDEIIGKISQTKLDRLRQKAAQINKFNN